MTHGSVPEDLLRTLAPQVLGVVVRRFGDFHDAEDAVQEALLAAATQWPQDGIPDNPKAWLVQVASRRMTDRFRSESARRRREERVVLDEPPGAAEITGEDDSLVLLFLCCHPVLPPASAIGLTLRAVGGLTTAEIARAFLVPEATMAQRLSRAKQRIAASGIRFALPTPEERADRIAAVLHVLYLMFTEGHATTSGPQVARAELCSEAIRLTRAAHERLPDEPEVAGLLALMLLTDARRPARTGESGRLVPLADQDRSRWERSMITEGDELISATLTRGAVGGYQLQAAIAAVHDLAPTADATDWPQILALYGLLDRMSPNPMVALNRAVAAAMVHGPDAGLALLAELDGPLAGHHRLDAVRAHLLERAGRPAEAVRHYRSAAGRTTSAAERDYLLAQAARLNG